jgi:selenium metabolism protein YedF
MRIVDTRGQLCPAPIILAKRALKETGEGESFIVVTDSKVSLNNLQRFLNDNKCGFTVEENAGVWRLAVTKMGELSPKIKPEEYCTPQVAHFEKGDFVVVVSSDRMGEGDEELGRLLMGNFIKALKDLEKLPMKILFYNRGVTLLTRNSPEIEHIRQLAKMDVEILACSTCINYYKLENEIAAGTLSNMFTIAEAMVSAGKIIKP